VEGYQIIPISELAPSLTNPRKNFKDLEDLTASVSEKGVLQPLLVRPGADNTYEIIAGECRYRAARAAGLDSVPAIVRDLNDQETLEIQLIENVQRKDLQPMEEAYGYQLMLDRTAYDVPSLAAKIGKSEAYVYQRLKLLDLIDEARRLLETDEITFSHAILLARLQPADQAAVLEQNYEERWRPGGRGTKEICSVRDLAVWIEQNIHLDLKNAVFSLKDESLLEGVGSCIECPKRTGFSPQLFPDIAKKDTCTDRGCYARKRQAHIERKLAAAQKKGAPLAKISTKSGKPSDPEALGIGKYREVENISDCPSARKAIVIEGYSRIGSTMVICDDPKCPVHAISRPTASSAEDIATQKAEKEQAKIAELVREGIVHRVLEAIPDPPGTLELRIIARHLVDQSDRDHLADVAGEDVDGIGKIIQDRIEIMTAPQLVALCLKLILVPVIKLSKWDSCRLGVPEIMAYAATNMGVDLRVVQKEVKAQLKPRQPKKKAPKAAPKSSANTDPDFDDSGQESASQQI
jgi:ParB family chromosome partitioning protein